MKKLLISSMFCLFTFSIYTQYYHNFQNFDDDVDRIKKYSNFWGGDSGIMNGDSTNPQIFVDWDITKTRTGFGRSLKLDYGPLDFWSMYVESFKQRWYDSSTGFDLSNLFPDYNDPDFQNRGIDSIVFYYLLQSDDPLTLKLELHDQQDVASIHEEVLFPSDENWQRIAVGLDQFLGDFDKSKAKFLGFTFANSPNNIEESGTLWIDDLYLVENGYSKPQFGNDFNMLNYTNQVNFRHFWTAIEPVSCFALDRHIWQDLISVDAIGFQLSSYVIAHKNNWVDQQLIESRVEHILNYLLNVCAHGNMNEVIDNPLQFATVGGNWAHFLDFQTLARKDIQTEFSLFSNALLLSGVYVAKEYFTSNNNIQSLAESLIDLTDWTFLYREQDTLMYYAWKPETGYSTYFTDWFSEELDLAFLLGISSPIDEHRLPINPYLSSGYNKPCCFINQDAPYVYSAPGSSFTYYFLQMYANFNDSKFDISRFQNAQYALMADLEFCNEEYFSLGYDERIFGTTACEGADSAGINQAGVNISNYHAYGYECRFDDVNEPNGTIAVYGSASPILFIPDESIVCLNYYYNVLDSVFINDYGYAFWSPVFGFPDAFHLAPDQSIDTLINALGFNGPWLSVPRFGIDIGPMLMNIDSYLSEESGTTSIRDLFSENEDIMGNLEFFDTIACTPTSSINYHNDSESNLLLCCPNPFALANEINIQFHLTELSDYQVKIFDISGNIVRTFTGKAQGNIKIVWNGTSKNNDLVKPGIYLCSLKTENFRKTDRIVLLK